MNKSGFNQLVATICEREYADFDVSAMVSESGVRAGVPHPLTDVVALLMAASMKDVFIAGFYAGIGAACELADDLNPKEKK